ncbi:MAG: SDR family oxidoreductase [Bacteroidales bacterium]|nr:SDR family oxidoreductase [Bacteroidales bacterium]
MNVFVTGATGFIGIHLVKYLAASGYIVHALYRNTNKSGPLANIENIKLFKGDITEPQSLEKAMQGCEQVYHVAAFADVWAKDPSIIYKLNVEATEKIFEIALKKGIKKVVFTSTAGIYGPSLNGEITETTTRSLDFFVEYERTKFIAEEKAREYVKKGLDIVIINPTRVYGPGLLSKSNSVTLMIKKFNEGKWRIIPGNGKSIGNYVFVQDVVQGHLLAMEKGKTGENYILGGTNASYIEFFQTLRELTGRKHRLYKLPLFIMLFSAQLMMIITKLTGKPPLITPPLIRKFNYQWDVSSKKAETELGYKITTLSEGMQKVLDWVNNEKTH